MHIVHDDSSEFTVSFDPQQPITIDDDADVIPMVDDPPLVTYEAADARAEELSVKADALYSDVLHGLQPGIQRGPDRVTTAVGKMRGLRTAVEESAEGAADGGPFAGQFAGPRFRFVQ